ncbi:MAG TPA: HD domain-containing phosphohydrolase, partial [Solirubrobacteraceae bacterium]
EARDAYTGKHAERVTAYGIAICSAVGLELADGQALEFGFLLHDIGKVAIPDAILYKPGKLTEKERALMAQHPVIGAEIVREIDFLGEATKVVRSHHERWDGSGYPDGLAGEEIPLPARVFAVAREMIVQGSGSQFDPQVVEAFIEIPDDAFERIAREIK